MVNKEKILQQLKNTKEPISGELLSSILGISRTAVWKNINSLKNSGYNILGGAKGYTLEKKDDMLAPYEFQGDSSLITYVKTTSSTMDIARELIEKGKGVNNSVIVSESQSNSVSKKDSAFNSPLGGLYFTMIFYPDSPISHMNLYPIAGTIAVKTALKDILGINTTIKWPFENYIEGKKVSGIITETHLEKNRLKWQTLGIGINRNLKGKRRELLERIKEIIASLIDNPEELLARYIDEVNILGSVKSFNIEGKTYTGKVMDIDIQGTLTLEDKEVFTKCFIGNSTQED